MLMVYVKVFCNDDFFSVPIQDVMINACQIKILQIKMYGINV